MRHPITDTEQSGKEIEATIDGTSFLDLIMESLEFDNSSLPPDDTPAGEAAVPQQPQTEYNMPQGAAWFSLQQPALPAPAAAPPVYQPPAAPQPNYFQMFSQAAPFSHSQVNNVQYMTLPQGQGTNLTPLGIINGQVVYGLPTYTAPPVTSDVPVVQANSRKRKFFKKTKDASKPYVKKPPNAFMIYRMEQRPNVVAELQNTDCAAVNRLIGKRWRSMTQEEQKKYYESAQWEKQLHSQLFPEWSAGDNYGQKKKRIRRKGPAVI
ncbi:transcription factor 7-like [Paralichthys olivaceus]|uniref:transcription factor 7-like n=1 Tax=Paralichthys olivaceus TaxID=8255 RepID=UPI0037513F68